MAGGAKKVIFAALIGNALVAATKFAAALITGSSAMLSEGIHSLVDTGNQILLLYGLHRSKQPADERFPFGHGKEVYFWSFVVAILIFAVGSGVSLYEGVIHLLHPEPMEKPYVNYLVLILALVFEGAAWTLALKEFSRGKGKWGLVQAVRRGKDPSLFVVLFEDSAAMLGLLAALSGVGLSHLTGNPSYDGAASLVIGLILGGTAAWLAYETKGLLIGEGANQEVVEGIRDLARPYKEIECINEILTLHMGPEFILVTISADFSNDANAEDVEIAIYLLVEQIKRTYPKVKKVFISAEDRSAKICTPPVVTFNPPDTPS
jgi:cation diffusion facilitator family transporter